MAAPFRAVPANESEARHETFAAQGARAFYAVSTGKCTEAVTIDELKPLIDQIHYENSAHELVISSRADLSDKILRMELETGNRLHEIGNLLQGIEARLGKVERLITGKNGKRARSRSPLWPSLR